MCFGNHFTVYPNIKLLQWALETNIMYVNYNSVKKSKINKYAETIWILRAIEDRKFKKHVMSVVTL